jgi:hypothetical protein
MKFKASLRAPFGLLLALLLLAGCGGSGSAIQTLSPTPRPPIFTVFPASGPLPNGTVGAPYNKSKSCLYHPADKICIYSYGVAIVTTGGVQPFASSWVASRGSSLPPGLSLDASGGVISGTPTTVGTYNFLVTVTDSESPPKHVSAYYSIAVAAPSPSPSPSPSPNSSP